jgi:flagellar hook-associated protein 3 FlgL
MTSSFIRTGSANTFDAAVRNITSRQSALASLQDNLTSGKKVVRASDDPTGAANAERALTRINRIVTDQRALDSQRNAIAMAESTLGDVTDNLQYFRELVVSAGDGAYSASERKSIAVQLTGLRDQIISLANRKDTNGLPLFSALGSALTPFVGPQATAPDYTFKGLPGQAASSDVGIPFTLDGDGAFMLQPGRDMVYNIQSTPSAASSVARTDPISVEISKNSATAANVGVTFNKDSAYTIAITKMTLKNPATDPNTGYAEYTITGTAPDGSAVTTTGTADFDYNLPITLTIPDTTANPPGAPLQPQVDGIPGIQVNLKGDVRELDTFTITPVVSVFSVLDNAIRDIGNATDSTTTSQAVAQALNNIDVGMERISAVRGQAGDLLNRADRISSNQDKRSIQLESDRSRAEDLDMIKGISDFQNRQTGFSAALQSYAQVQKLSLFNFIG